MALVKHDRALLEAAEAALLEARERVKLCGPAYMVIYDALAAVVTVLHRGDGCEYTCPYCQRSVDDERLGCPWCVPKIIGRGRARREGRELRARGGT